MTVSISEILNGVASRLVYEGSICDTHPCWNDGTCELNGTSNFYCDCLPAFIGPRCQFKLVDVCRSQQCHLKKMCTFDDFHVNCSAVSQFDFLTSCLSTQCLNGGVCQNITGLYRCNCPEAFHGPFCQFDSNDTNYEWNTIEIVVFFFVIFMVAFAVAIVCCASTNHMGFYISVPNKHYNRWEEEDDFFDDSAVENGEQLVAMADIRKGIVVSRTRETVLEDLEDTNMLQL